MKDKPSLKKEKVFIFDFDGVIADSFEIAMATLNSLAEKYRFNRVDLARINNLRKLNSWQLYVEEFGIAPWKLIFGVRAARKAMKEKMIEIKPVAGIGKVLKELKEQNLTLGIISSNSAQNVQLFLERNRLEYFSFIVSGQIFFKHRSIIGCLRQHCLNQKNIFYVGDETRDIEAARKAGVGSIAVSWGYTDREILAKYRPDYLIDSSEELLNL